MESHKLARQRHQQSHSRSLTFRLLRRHHFVGKVSADGVTGDRQAGPEQRQQQPAGQAAGSGHRHPSLHPSPRRRLPGAAPPARRPPHTRRPATCRTPPLQHTPTRRPLQPGTPPGHCCRHSTGTALPLSTGHSPTRHSTRATRPAGPPGSGHSDVVQRGGCNETRVTSTPWTLQHMASGHVAAPASGYITAHCLRAQHST